MSKTKETFDSKLQRALQDRATRGRIVEAVEDAVAIIDRSTSKGRARGGGQSSKKKGRDACLVVQALILKHFPNLSLDDVYVKTGSAGGADLHLSPRAQKLIPYSIEVKGAEGLSIWAMLAQAQCQADKDGRAPLVLFKRARTEVYAAVRALDFLTLLALYRSIEADVVQTPGSAQ